jgi:predicted ATPase
MGAERAPPSPASFRLMLPCAPRRAGRARQANERVTRMSTAEQETGIDDEDRKLLREILTFYESGAALPEASTFGTEHVENWHRLNALKDAGLIDSPHGGHYYLTLRGLRECNSPEARTVYGRCRELLPKLREAFLAPRGKLWTTAEFGTLVGRSTQEISRLVTLLKDVRGLSVASFDPTGFVGAFQLHEPIPDARLPDWPEEPPAAEDAEEPAGESWIERVEVSGYRPFAQFSAELRPLTVIIGANASGKSSLFDLLRLLAFAAENPLPPGIDPRNTAVSALFHAGGPEHIDLHLTVASGQGEPLRYEVSILGPVGAPRVARERLVAAGPPGEDAKAPFVFLDFTGGRGTVRDPRERTLSLPWSSPPNELALRRARQPALLTVSRFQKFVATWRFYPGFDVSPLAAVRRPAHIEENPILTEDGSNLSAVLNSLVLEHRDAWEELETQLRSVLPSFESLGVRPRGGRGMAIGVVRERGVKEELTLADLSDGTLRLLCLLALAVAPNPPPLICIDEPETGLHPRVLPVLGGAFRLASAHSQILIATHSPYFLSQFELADIAVMRKEDGHAVFVRPATSEALRREVAEDVGGEAITRLFLSDELEVLP